MPTVATAATMAARSQPPTVPLGTVEDGDGIDTMILDGVDVGEGVAIGAGTVMTKDAPSYSVVAGIPGRVLCMREKSS